MATVEQKIQGPELAEDEKLASVGEIIAKPGTALLSPREIAGEPTLQRAEFFSHTHGGGDNKDMDTGVSVTITTGGQSTLLARSVNADSSGTDATTYNDGSDHFIKLVVENTVVTKSECQDFIVRVRIQTNGNDTWDFDGAAMLYFSDGSNLFAAKDNIHLENDGATAYFHAPGAI